MRPRVYIVNESGHDFSAAEEYGDLVPLTTGFIAWDKLNLAHRIFASALQHSSPDDYLLISGPMSICSIASAIFGRIHGRLNLLVFAADARRYLSYRVEIDKLLLEP